MSTSDLLAWAQLAGLVVTALASAALVWFTAVLARETKRLAAAGSQPQVILTIEPSEHGLNFMNTHIENTGTATAYDIGIEFEPPLEFVSTSSLPRAPLERISLLKPGQRISSFLCKYDELRIKSFAVRIRWKRRPKSTEVEELSYTIDINHLEGMTRLGTPPLHEIAGSVKKIAKDFGDAVSGFSRLKVDTFSTEDRETEDTEQKQAVEEFRRKNQSSAKGSDNTNPSNE